MTLAYAWVGDLLILATLTAIGAVFVRRWVRLTSRLLAVSLGFPLGLGWVTWVAFLASWAGIRITIVTFVTISAVSLIALVVPAERGDHKQPIRNRTESREPKGSSAVGLLAALAAGGLALAAVILSVGRAYSVWDSIAIWGVKGLAIAREGTIFAARSWGAHGLSYPFNLTLGITMFRLFDGDVLPGSKLIYPAFYASALGFAYSYWRSQSVGRAYAGLGTLLIASVPVFFEHATNGYSNLAYATYLASGAALASLGIQRADRGRQLLGGILLGFAAVTRPDGVAMASTVAAIVVAYGFWLRKENPPGSPLLAPLAVICVSWVIFLKSHVPYADHLDVVPQAARSLGMTDLHLGAFLTIAKDFVKQALDLPTWGIALPVFGLLLAVGTFRASPALRSQALVLLGAAAALGALITFYYYLTTFGDQGLDWWLSTTRARMLFPPALLMFLASGLVCPTALPTDLSRKPRPDRPRRRPS